MTTVPQADLDRLPTRRHPDAVRPRPTGVRRGDPKHVGAPLGIGALGVLGADCVYGWIQFHGSWKVGGPTDLGWVLFYLCWGAAALHPAMREVTVEQPWRPRHLSLSRLPC